MLTGSMNVMMQEWWGKRGLLIAQVNTCMYVELSVCMQEKLFMYVFVCSQAFMYVYVCKYACVHI